MYGLCRGYRKVSGGSKGYLRAKPLGLRAKI